jgi:hypothetical protein
LRFAWSDVVCERPGSEENIHTLKLPQQEIWFVAGSQHLYGNQALAQVAEHSKGLLRF